jgi:HECT-domain (ubiquitin-transferase)
MSGNECTEVTLPLCVTGYITVVSFSLVCTGFVFVQTELDTLLRGVGEEWTAEGVLDAIKCDHGYSRTSSAVLAFVTALTELSHDEKRALLRFVTGSPRLPPGGLAALRPRLTIVKKHGQGTWFNRCATKYSRDGVVVLLETVAVEQLALLLCSEVCPLPFRVVYESLPDRWLPADRHLLDACISYRFYL